MVHEKWNSWSNIHGTEDQKKRIASAKKSENTPVNMDRDAGTGSFVGSHGQYTTQLDSCSCADFIRRKLPCKHMYRLAIELGVFGDKSGIQSDEAARKIPRSDMADLIVRIISTIENYCDEEQREIKRILLEILYRKRQSVIFEDATIIHNAIKDGLLIGNHCYSYFIQKMLKRDMIKVVEDNGDVLPKDCKLSKDIAKWMIDRANVYGPITFPNCMEVLLSAELNSVSLSVYKYLHRKLDEDAHTESYYDPEPNTIKQIEKGFPKDFETSLLDMFGTNPLK